VLFSSPNSNVIYRLHPSGRNKELPFSGVFAVRDGRVTLVTDELEGPDGLAFSPDERYLYVGN
jgi:gluconolactonase